MVCVTMFKKQYLKLKARTQAPNIKKGNVILSCTDRVMGRQQTARKVLAHVTTAATDWQFIYYLRSLKSTHKTERMPSGGVACSEHHLPGL